MPMPPISIIVPTFREAENIPVLTERLFESLSKAGLDAELIIVDDDSRDGTPDVVAELATRHPIRLITRTGERGLSTAVICGFEEASHDVLVCMDADLSHPPAVVPQLVAAVVEEGADFCIGSRYVAGGRTEDDWGFLRRINSLGATLLARPLTPVADPMAGFFCLPRESYDRAKTAGLNPIGYKIGLEILIKARCTRPAEIPIEFAERLHGESKLSLKQQLHYLTHLIRLYRFRWPIGVWAFAIACLSIVLLAAYCFVPDLLNI